METYDIIVVGGGPAGYTAALEAAKSGVRVALIEEDELGGTCLNRGCIPTKIFLETVDLLEKIETAEAFGLNFSGNVEVNRETLLQRKQKIITQLKEGLRMLILSSSIEIINGRGKLKGKGEVIVSGEKPCTIKGGKIIIATGTKEAGIKIDGSEYMMGSTECLELKTVPKDVCIIGGGVIGVELATFYSGMGCKVHILEALDKILVNLDVEMAGMMHTNLTERGIEISTDSKVNKIQKENTGLKVIYECKGVAKDINADIVINATGRTPNTKDIGLESCGIKLDRKGYIKVDKYFKTTAENVYAAGDVTGGLLLAHVAFNEGTQAARNAVDGKEHQVEKKVVPACIYTHPEMASVGMTEEEAKAYYKKLRKGYFPMSANGRSLAAGSNKGLVKVITEDELGQIVGIHIIGESATEIIGAAAVAIEGEYTCDEFAELIIPHPTVCEALKDAVTGCVRN